MPRRSVPHIDPDCDLSQHLIDLAAVGDNWDLQTLFARPAPLELEIGSGKGLFLSQAAVARSDRNFLGVEIARKYARLAAYRLARRHIENACVFCGDARQLLAVLLPSEAVTAVHLYFPDPWWKKRHHKRRLVNAEFVRHIERVLGPGGKLHFWTDVEEYYQRSLETLEQHTHLTGPTPVPERPATHQLDYRTHFERKKRLAGSNIYRCEFEKQSR